MLLMKSTDSLGLLIHQATQSIRRRFEQRAGVYGLSAAQWRLLVHVKKEPGVAQARLAELLEIEPISVSRLIDRMEQAGWIERRQSTEDRRVRTVHPTAKAKDVFDAMHDVADELYDEALAGLSGAERATILKGLRTIVGNLSEEASVPERQRQTEATEA